MEARLYLDHVEIWYGQKKVDFAAAAGTSEAPSGLPAHHRVAGAQAVLRELPLQGRFVSSRFRMAYDALRNRR